MSEKEIILSLEEETIAKLENKIKETNFNSIQDYLNYILNTMLTESQEKDSSQSKEIKSREQRLKELGYM